ncbi:MAG: S10 family serine carboxypeptidase-like protein [Steroidobacteraceae bacterium]
MRVERIPATLLVLLLGLSIWGISIAQTPPMSYAQVQPLVTGDEPIVVTRETLQTATGPLQYETRAGRLPIRNELTEQVLGHVFFVAYIALNRGQDRPLAFAWNGGPIIPSIYIHTEWLGPKLITRQGIVDNPQTLLQTTDLVFYDPIDTGFSRPSNAADASQFMHMKGDVSEAVDSIRAYERRFGAEDRPKFLIGESYGVWRACAVAERLAQRKDHLVGAVLVSGDLPGIHMPLPFFDAMHIPARTATALYYHRLPPDLQAHPKRTMERVDAWVRNTYLSALMHPARLSAAQRAKIVDQLAGLTGVSAELINPKTMVMSIAQYLREFLGQGRTLSDIDTRTTNPHLNNPGTTRWIGYYLRHELGYSTDLVYLGVEDDGYLPTLGPDSRSMFPRWTYDEADASAAIVSTMIANNDPKYIAATMSPWIERAMALDANLRVFVATGSYDPLNMCEGDALMASTLAKGLANRITTGCYEGGHLMYRDERTRVQLSHDVTRFMRESMRNEIPGPLPGRGDPASRTGRDRSGGFSFRTQTY